jgi:hypothetical protein
MVFTMKIACQKSYITKDVVVEVVPVLSLGYLE